MLAGYRVLGGCGRCFRLRVGGVAVVCGLLYALWRAYRARWWGSPRREAVVLESVLTEGDFGWLQPSDGRAGMGALGLVCRFSSPFDLKQPPSFETLALLRKPKFGQ